MALDSISDIHISAFKDIMVEEYAQMVARTKEYVSMERFVGNDLGVDTIGQVDATESKGRLTKVTWDDIDFGRRQLAPVRVSIVIPIDKGDVQRRIADPTGRIAKKMAEGMQRKFDSIVIKAATADVVTGRDFDTTVTFAADGGRTVDATAGLTYEKLLEIKKNYVDDDIPFENMKVGFFISGAEEEALMKENELTSGDFTRNFAVENAQMVNAVGMNIHKFAANAKKPILNVASSVRDNIVLTQDAITFGEIQPMELQVQERTDYLQTTQLVLTAVWGAVRNEGKRVQKVTTTVA